MLTPSGLLLPLMPGIISPIGIPMLLPLTLMAIPAVSMAVRLLPRTVLVIPPVSIAIRRLPLMVLAIPTIGLATVLLPLMRLPVPAVSMASRLIATDDFGRANHRPGREAAASDAAAYSRC